MHRRLDACVRPGLLAAITAMLAACDGHGAGMPPASATAVRSAEAAPAAAATPARSGAAPASPSIQRGRLRVGGLERTYLYHVPDRVGEGPGLVLVFHGGSGGTGARVRELTRREFDRLADARGFIVVYPDGIAGGWNECRRSAGYEANLRGIDDVAFVRALIAEFRRTHGIDPKRVRAFGFSAGAHMALRLALEMPQAVGAVAAIGANLPTEQELDCLPSGRPASVMFVNGTADPINPYAGGTVKLPDGFMLGVVRGAGASLGYFGRLAGHDGAPERARLIPADSAGLAVEWAGWRDGRHPVSLYTVVGGGHTIPVPGAAFPAYLGATERRFNAVAEAVRFFGL